MKAIDITLSSRYWLGIILVGLFSAGIGGFLFWMFTRRAYPKTIDEEGVTSLNGRRYFWKDLQDMQQVSLVLAGSDIRISGELNLQFAGGAIHIKPVMIDNEQEVLAFLSVLFGRPVAPG